MAPRKNKATLGWAQGFVPPTLEDQTEAVGSFPWHQSAAKPSAGKAGDEERRRHWPQPDRLGGWHPPSLRRRLEAGSESEDPTSRLQEAFSEAMKHVDCPAFFDNPIVSTGSHPGTSGKKRRKTAKARRMWQPVREPFNDHDWLAVYNDEGQTFSEYLVDVSMRSGRFKTSHFGGQGRTPERQAIGLLPILPRHGTGKASAPAWEGPSLELLAKLTEIYFDRPVQILDPATITVAEADTKKPGGFNAKAHWTHPQTSGRATPIKQVRVQSRSRKAKISGAVGDATTADAPPRFQVHVDPLLSILAHMMGTGPPETRGLYCIMGVTLIDLYSHPTDLFVAGMAAGGSNVAVFSFHRYHPCLKMDPGDWDDYGYAKVASDYSYFEDGRKRPAVSFLPPASSASKAPKQRIGSEWLRRSGKLLVHELMHIFGIDHCIYSQCIMNGTGHLVEDFLAPMELCPVDLRKMQWRLCFDVTERYELLAAFYEARGWSEDASFVRQRLAQLGHASGRPDGEDSTEKAAFMKANRRKGQPHIIALETSIDDDDIIDLT